MTAPKKIVAELFPDAEEYIELILKRGEKTKEAREKYGCPYGYFTLVFKKLPQDLSTLLLVLKAIGKNKALAREGFRVSSMELLSVKEAREEVCPNTYASTVLEWIGENASPKQKRHATGEVRLMWEAIRAHPGEYCIYLG